MPDPPAGTVRDARSRDPARGYWAVYAQTPKTPVAASA